MSLAAACGEFQQQTSVNCEEIRVAFVLTHFVFGRPTILASFQLLFIENILAHILRVPSTHLEGVELEILEIDDA